MEGRMQSYGKLSPGRAKVWTEKSPKYKYNLQLQQENQQCNHKVPVIYYLSSNRQLEHPHFMEVQISSPDGLHLRDVMERLNVLRGRGMAAKYSWSCKRSYRNGYVWHDICEDDLILPAHGDEYVLKGSELIEELYSDGSSPAGATVLHKSKERFKPRIRDESSLSSNLNSRRRRNSETEYHSPPNHRYSSSVASPDSPIIMKETSVNCDPRFINASTQTEIEPLRTTDDQEARVIEEGSFTETHNAKQSFEMKGTSEMCREFSSTPLSESSDSLPGYMANTLESLIRDDIRKLNTSKRSIETEGARAQKLKPGNLIMQLISCGSIYVKDHNLDMIPSYNHSFLHSKFSSPAFSTSFMADLHSENPRISSLKDETKEYFSECLAQTMILRDHHHPSSSNGERRTIHVDSDKSREKASYPTLSPWTIQSSRYAHEDASPHGSGRMVTGEKVSTSPEGNVNKIEERLGSGARVVIQSAKSI